MRTRTTNSELARAKESATVACALAETHRQAEELEIFRCALIGGCWHGEAVGGPSRSRTSYVID